MNVYKVTGDKAFLDEIFDKLYRFHQWWYAERDHDHNGICEYGSTDGTLIAAAWESGMDNGVRFDDTRMLKNEMEKAWSMDQENICLNSFLYVDKLTLSEMASILGKQELSEQLAKEAEVIKLYVQTKMYDSESGFFYDIRLNDRTPVKVMGAEGWLPLWAGIATPEQAESVKNIMMDEKHFNKLGKSSCVVNRDFSGCVATGVHAPSQRMLHIPYIGNKCFINGSSKIIQTRLLAIVRILLPIRIQQKFTMRNRKQLVLGIYIILNKWFIVSFQRFFYNTPANQVIPA
jgi:hypothetical protein